jgi:hypothetical protein
MKTKNREFAAFGATLAVLGLMGSLVKAQEPQQPPAANPQQPPAANQNPPANNARTRPLSNVLFSISRSSGISVVADSSLVNQVVAMPENEVTAANLEDSIAAVVASLPSGTVWAKLYLPEPKGNRGFNGDAVADYALAQAKLFGNVGGATPAGTIEVMGQKVTADKVPAVTAALNLKPVYILANPNRKTVPETGNSSNWASMTPEQRQQAAQQQAQQLMNMDPNARAAYIQQQRAVMESLMQSMTPQQRAEFVRSMGGGERGGRGNRGDQPNRP